ncbi:uncharacterized protein BJX67DRAFT_329356 [Aspergillus lucknowensis]|uniref:Uncharacterized protein n=1 Tax=Aspergillus lucknowensis TaxID=176173 RepID=A0ABR4L955_9EURO
MCVYCHFLKAKGLVHGRPLYSSMARGDGGEQRVLDVSEGRDRTRFETSSFMDATGVIHGSRVDVGLVRLLPKGNSMTSEHVSQVEQSKTVDIDGNGNDGGKPWNMSHDDRISSLFLLPYQDSQLPCVPPLPACLPSEYLSRRLSIGLPT